MLRSVKLCAFYLELVLDASKAIFFIAKTSQIVCISSRVGFGCIQNHFIPCQNQSNCVHLLEFAYFRLLKSVKLYAFSLELVLDASKTILFRAKISQIVQVCLGMVLDASKTILFHAKISQIVCILSRVRIFSIAKTSQIVCISSRVGFGRVLKSVKLYPFARVSLFFDCQIQSNSVDFIFSWFWTHPKPFFFSAKISQIV